MSQSGEGRKRARSVAALCERRIISTDICDSRKMIVRARLLVTMNGPPIENGAVAIEGNRIDDSPPGSSPSRAARQRRAAPAGSVVDVGLFNEVKSRNSGEVVDLGEQALLPGLINAHCHLDYTCLRGKIPPPKSFADWIRAINTEKAKLSKQHYLASINEGFAEAKKFGTTTIANLEAFPELVAKIRSRIRTWWFTELLDVRSPERAKEVIDLAMESLKQATNWGLAPHAPFTASANLYRHCEEIARRENIFLTTHLAESREEMSMFREASGPLYEFMKGIGRPMDDCGHETPLALFVGRCALPGRWIIAHLNELAESDFDLLERSRRKFHVVHSPRSHGYFAHSRFPFERLRALGCNICLGTDSLASNEDLSLFAEMRAFQKNEPRTSPEEIVSMVTVNPARALRQEDALGKIRPGFCADLIAIPCARSTNALEEIIAFDRPVDWAVLDGKIR
jgi:cytosine/adenosine deaminase-related metal-dependent hydrolase